MRPVLLYGDGTALSGTYHHSGTTSENFPFFLIPERGKVFIKVMPVSNPDKKPFRKTILSVVQTSYPGSREDILFDIMVWGKKDNRTAAVYIIKKETFLPHCSNQMFKGIIIPIQLVGKKDFTRFSQLVFLLPDTVEVWHIDNSVPVLVKGENKDTFTFGRFRDVKNQILVIGPAGKNSRSIPKNVVYRTFNDIVDTLRIKPVVFKNIQCRGETRLIPFLEIAIFIFSSLLIVLSLSEWKKIKIETHKTSVLKKMTIRKEEASDKKVKRIKELEKSLIQMNDNSPVNIYFLIFRLKRIADTGTKIDSIKWTQGRLTISCRSTETLATLKLLKDEFGVIQVSEIHPISGGNEAFSVTVEEKR